MTGVDAGRRQLLAGGLIGVTAAALPLDLWGTTPPDSGGLQRLVLIDARFDAARRLGDLAARRGCEVQVLGRDVLDPWHRLLLPRIRSGALRGFTGVTSERARFAFATLAASEWRRRQVPALPVAGPSTDEPLLYWSLRA